MNRMIFAFVCLFGFAQAQAGTILCSDLNGRVSFEYQTQDTLQSGMFQKNAKIKVTPAADAILSGEADAEFGLDISQDGSKFALAAKALTFGKALPLEVPSYSTKLISKTSGENAVFLYSTRMTADNKIFDGVCSVTMN